MELEEELKLLRIAPADETQDEREERRNKRMKLFKQLVSMQKALAKPKKEKAGEEEEEDEEGFSIEKKRKTANPGTIAKTDKKNTHATNQQETGNTGEVS